MKIWSATPNTVEAEAWRLSLTPEERDIVRELDADLADILEWDSASGLRVIKQATHSAANADVAMDALRQTIPNNTHFFYEYVPEANIIHISILGR